MNKTIKIPNGMLHAALNEFFKAASLNGYPSLTDLERMQFALKAALSWLSENPIIPTSGQVQVMQVYLHTQTADHGPGPLLSEWQRRMFLAPEPEVPREIRNLFIAEVDEPASEFNARIVEAYRLGQKAGSR